MDLFRFLKITHLLILLVEYVVIIWKNGDYYLLCFYALLFIYFEFSLGLFYWYMCTGACLLVPQYWVKGQRRAHRSQFCPLIMRVPRVQCRLGFINLIISTFKSYILKLLYMCIKYICI